MQSSAVEISWTISVKTANEGDNKFFWNYVRSRRNGTNNLVTLKVDTDALTDHKDIADSFNRYFASVFTLENLTYYPNFPQVVRTENLTQVSTTLIEVGKLLLELNANKSCGPDDIHPRILKHCSNSLASPLCALFNTSFKCGENSPWLENSKRLFRLQERCKRQSRKLQTCFSNLSCKSNLREDCQEVDCKLLDGTSSLQRRLQFGRFMKKRSCLSQLLDTFHLWAKARNDSHKVVSVSCRSCRDMEFVEISLTG